MYRLCEIQGQCHFPPFCYYQDIMHVQYVKDNFYILYRNHQNSNFDQSYIILHNHQVTVTLHILQSPTQFSPSQGYPQLHNYRHSVDFMLYCSLCSHDLYIFDLRCRLPCAHYILWRLLLFVLLLYFYSL